MIVELPLRPQVPWKELFPACEGDVTYTWTYTDCAGFTHDYVHTVTITRVDFTAPSPTTAAVDCYADIVLPTPSYRYRRLWNNSYAHRSRGRKCSRL